MVDRSASSVPSAVFSVAWALALAAPGVAFTTAAMSVWTATESNAQVMTSLSAVSRFSEASDSATW